MRTEHISRDLKSPPFCLGYIDLGVKNVRCHRLTVKGGALPYSYQSSRKAFFRHALVQQIEFAGKVFMQKKEQIVC